jgi:AcrR family transcriptional regulator
MQSKNQNDQPKRTFIEAARRKQLIKCAIDALAETGYIKTSLAQIAKRANISTSVVSYYFAGKDDLMREVITEVYSDAARYMEAHIDATAAPSQILRAYIDSNLNYGRNHLKELKAMAEIVMHWRTADGSIPAEANSDDAIFKPLEEIFSYGQETGEFRTFATRPMAVTVRKAIDSALEQWLSDPSIDRDAYTQELITLFDLATRKRD